MLYLPTHTFITHWHLTTGDSLGQMNRERGKASDVSSANSDFLE